jgi:DnaD/phage-associated family protein
MSTIKFNGTNIYNSIPVSKKFVEEYMPKAAPSYVKVYLYGLNLCISGESKFNNKYIADKLNLIESDVINAWKYWHSEGVVSFSLNENNTFTLEFFDLNSERKTNNDKPERIFIESRPSYSQKDISDMISKNKSISHIYKEYEKKSGRPISPSDMSIIYSMYDWLKLPPEVIIMLFEYCFEKGKKSIRYIEKVAIDWSEKELYDLNKVEEYLKELEDKSTIINKVKKSFGIYDRKMSSSEIKYVEKWTYDYGYDLDILNYAYDLTIMNTGNLSFPYINSILTSWNKKGIKTLKDAERINIKKSEPSGTTNNKKLTSINNKSKNFSKINTRTYDFKEIEKLAKTKKLK